jgi:hypothetical protein
MYPVNKILPRTDNLVLQANIEAEIKIKVCLVLKDRGWILEKMASRLADELPNWGVDAKIDSLPSSKADINHWMLYYDLEGNLYSKNTLAITHVDRFAKLHILKRRLEKFDLGICLSRMTLERLVLSGIPRHKLCYITPAHDGNIKPNRIVIGITSQIRPDGAKREHILIQMARAIRLDTFHFEIVGPGWEQVIPYFEAAGATVSYSPGLYKKDNAKHLHLIMEKLKCFDYYLYMGWDEGSMGILDALAAGIPTIVTPQGFHLDINGGITHPFSSTSELCAIFKRLADERQSRADCVARLTWNEYARQHALAWHALLGGPCNGINALLHDKDLYEIPLPTLSRSKRSMCFNEKAAKTGSKLSALIEDLSLLWRFYTNTNFYLTRVFRLTRSLKRLLG